MENRLAKEKGFTLIELVIVIILIGILAATALPKFADLSGQAHTAANQGIAGSLAAAVNIAHGAWVAAGGTSAQTGVPLECGANNIRVNTSGWPNNASTCAGAPAGAPAGDNTDCVNIWSNIMNNPPQATTGGCTQTGCYNAAGSGNASCTFTRANVAPTRSITYDTTTGAVTFTP